MVTEGSRPIRRSARRRAALGVALGSSLALLAGSAATAVDGTLPGGTGISVTITNPASELTIEVPTASDTANVPIEGVASVGGEGGSQNTSVLFILDTSGSMASGAGVDCTGDGIDDNRQVCQGAAVANAIASFDDPALPVGFVGIGSYASFGTVHDLDFGTDGAQLLVAPGLDGDANGTADPIEVATSLPASGGTSFNAGLDQALVLLGESTTAANRVIFVSDGEASANIAAYEGAFDAFGATRIDTFAVTTGSGCAPDSTSGLTAIAELTTGGTCTELEDISDLAVAFEEIVATELIDLTATLDGDAATDVFTVGLPGPVSDHPFQWEAQNLSVGTHEVCVTARGSDGSGEGTVTDCRTIHVVTASDTTGTTGTTPPSTVGAGTATPATPVSGSATYTG